VIDDNLNRGWKQHYPTYVFKNRDIAIEEYKTASKSLEAEERIFLNASNIAVLASAGLGSLAVGSLNSLTAKFTGILPPYLLLLIFLLLTAGFSWVALRYFADRQRAIVFAARKVIVLRRMLGLSYGSTQLVLPNWRTEGADEPFAIRLFPGWNTYVTYPYYAIAGISTIVLLFLLAFLAKQLESYILFINFPIWPILISISVCWGLYLAFIYRKALLDVHENMDTLLVKNLSHMIRLKIVTNFEYVIYRATLAKYELSRLHIEIKELKGMLVFIEDRDFYNHSGVSIKALLRATLGFMRIKRRSGGSTVTQQLIRTLFIIDQSKLIRRKIIEILLSFSFNRILNKNEQLELYLASVRFERGIYGVLEAMHYFFDKPIENASKAQSFFLIERVSNIHSLLLIDKIIQTVQQALERKILNIQDVEELIELYRKSITIGKIKDSKGELSKLDALIKI